MNSRLPSRWQFVGSITLLAGLFSGCSQADNPKIVDAPVPPKVEATSPPPKSKSKMRNYEDNPKYQKKMEKRYGEPGG